MTLVYGSVCSGVEAATMAWHPLGWRPKFFSEIEAFPSAVLAHHYGSNMPGEPLSQNGVPNYGDFTQIPADAGPIDLLVGGTPCQSFSVAGKRLGLDDPRGNLALEYLALARRLGARWIVWENVPGVLSSVTDAEDGEGGIQPGLEGREAGDEWIEESDFATFLSFVRECGYGFAYRVLDAQYVRVDGHAFATPQRRRRVFVVGYLGDWRRAAAVLLEPEGMRGDPAPCRKAGQGVAPTISSRPTGGGGLGTDFDLDGGLIPFDTTQITSKSNRSNPQAGDACHPLAAAAHPPAIAFGGGRTSGPLEVSTALTAHGHRIDFEVETFIAETIPPSITRKPYGDHESREGLLVAHTMRADGFDAGEDGTGRGTPIVPVIAPASAATLTRGAESAGKGGYAGRRQEDDQNIVAYPLDLRNATRSADKQDDQNRQGCGIGEVDDPSPTLTKEIVPGVCTQWAVRRLTPRECERLQRFPDDFTNVPWNGKATAPDGPRYKALGNSMAVNVMAWIGQRIDIMEKLIAEGRV